LIAISEREFDDLNTISMGKKTIKRRDRKDENFSNTKLENRDLKTDANNDFGIKIVAEIEDIYIDNDNEFEAKQIDVEALPLAKETNIDFDGLINEEQVNPKKMKKKQEREENQDNDWLEDYINECNK